MKTLFTRIIGVFFIFIFVFSVKLAWAESCSNSGQKQYRLQGDCETGERTCCPMLDTWSKWDDDCPSCDCSPGGNQDCDDGNGSQTCNSSCKWDSCECNSGYQMENGVCTAEIIECTAEKPNDKQNCGKCGTQTRDIKCDDTTGDWQTEAWGTCSGESGVCTPGESRNIEMCDISKCNENAECLLGIGDYCTNSCTWSINLTCYNPTECCCNGKSDIDGDGDGAGGKIYKPIGGICDEPYPDGCKC